jgi:hypothetical protein
MERCQHPRFADKTPQELRVGLQIRVQDLDGDSTLELSIKGLPDLNHAVLSQALL